jgi:hypothetical protein
MIGEYKNKVVIVTTSFADIYRFKKSAGTSSKCAMFLHEDLQMIKVLKASVSLEMKVLSKQMN